MISVVIVNYHSANQIERAIMSLSPSAVECEVIVVDNTCSYSEREVLGALQRLHEFHLILNDENVGFARACNQAFSHSKGSYIFLLNPDAFIISPCLGILRDFLENTPAAGSASPQVYWDDEMQYLFPCYPFPAPLQDFYTKLSFLSQTFRTFYSLAERRKNLALWRSTVPVRVDNLHGGVVMVRRSAVEQAGGLFDERFFLFYEDTDLFFRLRRKGYRLYIVPEAKAVHNYSHNSRKLEIMSQTGRLYYEKHFSRSLLLKIASLIPGGTLEGSYQDCGVWKAPPSFPVSIAFQDEYLFEWSPNPLFIPAIGCFGKGGEFALSSQVWNLIDVGRYYSRFTRPSGRIVKYTMDCWEKEA